MNRIRRFPVLATVLLVVGFGTGVFFMTSVGAGAASPGDPQHKTPAVTAQGKEFLNQFSLAFEAAADKVNPSVVPIYSESETKVHNPFGDMFGDEFFKRFFGQGQDQEMKQKVRSLGSGVIVSSDGYILTNSHVVDGATKLTVKFEDRREYTAKLVGRDSLSDIAVIKIDATDLPAASLGNSDSLRVGQWVIAVGNPFNLTHTVTAGIISATGRTTEMRMNQYEDYIQTDASINPGNSGGALADLDGNVIGINTAILSPNGAGNIGIGFAIPINMAKSIMHSLITTGKVSRGYLGLVPQDIDEKLAKSLNLKTTEGALVGDVSKGSPSEKGGVKRGDIIVAFNGTTVTGASQLRNIVAQAAPGSKASLDVLRDGKKMALTVTLGERPGESFAAGKPDENSEGQSAQSLGLTVQTLNASLAEQLGYGDDKGVVVSAVKNGSPADEAGLQRGDLIKEVNRNEVTSAGEFEKAIGKLGKDDVAALLVRRGSTTFFVAIQPE